MERLNELNKHLGTVLTRAGNWRNKLKEDLDAAIGEEHTNKALKDLDEALDQVGEWRSILIAKANLQQKEE